MVQYVEEPQYPQEQYPQEQYESVPLPINRGDKADILDKIRPDRIVEEIRHKLMGEEEIDGKWVENPHLKERAITYVGAWDIANLMLSASSQNIAISKLKDHEIRLRSLSIARTAQLMMLKNWKEYGIKGTDQLNYVHQILFTNTFITLKQSENEGIRNLIKGITTESRVVTNNEPPKNKGWKSIFRA